MSAAVIIIWLLPGLAIAGLQGFWHVTGADYPRICVYGWDMPTWMVYGVMLAIGPALLLAVIVTLIGKRIRS